MKVTIFILLMVSICMSEIDSIRPRAIGPTIEFVSKRFRMQEPNYFIFGFDAPDSSIRYKNQVKILISARFRMFEYTYDSILIPITNFKKGPDRIVYKRGLNFDVGYRQKNFWNVYDGETSRPMYETNYSPSGYVSWSEILPRYTLPFSVLFGYVHESNGGLPEVSRSWDRIYLGASLGALELNNAAVQLDLWYPWGLEENPDIYKYCGVGELTIYWQPFFSKGHNLSDFGISMAWKLASQNINNAELGFYCGPFQFINNKFFQRITPTFYLQLYVGRGENMLDYKDKHTSLRLGIATVY